MFAFLKKIFTLGSKKNNRSNTTQISAQPVKSTAKVGTATVKNNTKNRISKHKNKKTNAADQKKLS